MSEGFARLDQSRITQKLVIEACIKEMQDRMLDSANVLIDRKPVIGALIQHRFTVVGGRVASEVPRRFHEGIEGIGFPLGGLAATGAGDVHEFLEPGQGGPDAGNVDIGWQEYREILVGNGDGAAMITVDDRNGASPIALT